jgi:hypothetical protein
MGKNLKKLFRAAVVGATTFLLAACLGHDDPDGPGLQQVGTNPGVPSPAPSPQPAPAPGAQALVRLSWAAGTDPDIVGYRVYYGTASGSYQQAKGAGINVGMVTTHSISSGLQRGQRYYFAVTAFDATGNESAFSGEASRLVQ